MNKENELRGEIKSILEAMKEPEERIIDKHGSNEYGLDLILIKFDAFGKLIAYGVQIKTGDIKCSGKPTQKIKEIIGQLAIAFGKSVYVEGKEYKLDGHYVVTNGRFLGNSEDYIRSACAGIRNLHFIDGESLNEFRLKYGHKVNQFRET
jgi:hypothetical protein